MVVYGINAVIEALRAGRVQSLRVRGRDDDRLRALLDEAAARGVDVRQVPRDALDRRRAGRCIRESLPRSTAAPEVTLEAAGAAGSAGRR